MIGDSGPAVKIEGGDLFGDRKQGIVQWCCNAFVNVSEIEITIGALMRLFSN